MDSGSSVQLDDLTDSQPTVTQRPCRPAGEGEPADDRSDGEPRRHPLAEQARRCRRARERREVRDDVVDGRHEAPVDDMGARDDDAAGEGDSEEESDDTMIVPRRQGESIAPASAISGDR